MKIYRKNGEVFEFSEIESRLAGVIVIGGACGSAEIRGETIHNQDGSVRICEVRFDGTSEFVDVEYTPIEETVLAEYGG